MEGQVSKRVSTRISYSELSDSEDESSIIVKEVIERAIGNQNLNKKRQYKTAILLVWTEMTGRLT